MTVDEDRWRTAHTGLVGLGNIGVDLGDRVGGLHIAAELLSVQIQTGADFIDGLVVQPVVAFEKLIVKFPELPLFSGGNRRLGRFKSKTMVSQGKILENDFYLLGILLDHLIEDRNEPGTVRSLEIAEYGDRDRCVGRSLGRGGPGVEILDDIDTDQLHRLAGLAEQKNKILPGACFDLIDVPPHGNGFLQLSIDPVDSDLPLIVKKVDPAVVGRHHYIQWLGGELNVFENLPFRLCPGRGADNKHEKEKQQSFHDGKMHKSPLRVGSWGSGKKSVNFQYQQIPSQHKPRIKCHPSFQPLVVITVSVKIAWGRPRPVDDRDHQGAAMCQNRLFHFDLHCF